MNKLDNAVVLENFLPPECSVVIAKWIHFFECEFVISKKRSTKFGDYRPPQRGNKHRISVNHNLNSFAFLITTVHEFAHLYTWNQYENRVKPHGKEWKDNFQKMMKPFLNKNIFPSDIKHAIELYLTNPKASSCSDLNLFRILKRYDIQSADTHLIQVELLPIGGVFALPSSGRTFKKLELIKKRYRCVELNTNRIYLFSPVAEVAPL